MFSQVLIGEITSNVMDYATDETNNNVILV